MDIFHELTFQDQKRKKMHPEKIYYNLKFKIY